MHEETLVGQNGEAVVKAKRYYTWTAVQFGGERQAQRPGRATQLRFTTVCEHGHLWTTGDCTEGETQQTRKTDFIKACFLIVPVSRVSRERKV